MYARYGERQSDIERRIDRNLGHINVDVSVMEWCGKASDFEQIPPVSFMKIEYVSLKYSVRSTSWAELFHVRMNGRL